MHIYSIAHSCGLTCSFRKWVGIGNENILFTFYRWKKILTLIYINQTKYINTLYGITIITATSHIWA